MRSATSGSCQRRRFRLKLEKIIEQTANAKIVDLARSEIENVRVDQDDPLTTDDKDQIAVPLPYADYFGALKVDAVSWAEILDLVVSAGKHKRVVACASDQDVVSCSPVERISARPASKDVWLRTAGQEIVSCPAKEDITSLLAEEPVVPATGS